MVNVGLFFKFTVCKTVKDQINLLKLKLKLKKTKDDEICYHYSSVRWFFFILCSRYGTQASALGTSALLDKIKKATLKLKIFFNFLKFCYKITFVLEL